MYENVKVLIECAEKQSRVLFLQSDMTAARNINYEVAVRCMFIFGESVANMLVFGSVSDDGGMIPTETHIKVAGMTGASSEQAGSALVAYGLSLISAYVAGIDREGAFDGVDDPLTLLKLDIDLPDNIA